MGKRESVIKLLKQFKSEAGDKIQIKKMLLFGSRATGKAHRWSDIDLLIVSNDFKNMRFRERASRMYDYWNFDYPVDFLCYTPKEFDKFKKQPTIVKLAVKEGIAI